MCVMLEPGVRRHQHAGVRTAGLEVSVRTEMPETGLLSRSGNSQENLRGKCGYLLPGRQEKQTKLEGGGAEWDQRRGSSLPRVTKASELLLTG